MNPVLKDILVSNSAFTSSGDEVKVHSHVSSGDVQFLTQLVSDLNVTASLEVGLAFGVSALAICQAIQGKPGAHHIVIDPFANDPRYWRGVGLHNLERAGFKDLVEFHQAPSSTVLPQLAAQGVQVDFAFIDGEHSFDYVLIDFFYIDQILRSGGVVVFDDADWRSVRRAVRFAVSNRNYEVYRVMSSSISWKFAFYRAALFLPAQIARIARKVPSLNYAIGGIVGSDMLGIDQEFGLAGECIALRKIGPDKRPVHSFNPF